MKNIFKKEIQDICPCCNEIIVIDNPTYSHNFLCPECHEILYWNSNNKILSNGLKNNYIKKKNVEIKKKEQKYIAASILITLIDIVLIICILGYKNYKNKQIMQELNIIESNFLHYLDTNDFINAELEINKMSILDKLSESNKNLWKANRESFIHMYEEKSGRKILIDP